MINTQLIIVFILLQASIIYPLKVTVFGASGGVGQLVCAKFKEKQYTVTAVTRDIEKAKSFDLLEGCLFQNADARVCDERLLSCIDGCDYVVISIGTTAFPTSKWENGKNTPQIACVDTVKNILTSVEQCKKRPSKILLLSSIGVERAQQPPFSILNLYGVLSAKLESENLLIESSKSLDYQAIIVRPGRLVGAPFTNFDLAKLLNKNQGDSKGIIIDEEDVLNGDVERSDVATAITKLLGAKLATDVFPIVFSIINNPKENRAPSEFEWGKVLSLFTVDKKDLTTRYSS
jgi:nucleoside-diphosphate-sugar epimerase